MAQTVYRGPYEGLPQAWGELQAWIEDNGCRFAPGVWDCYVDSPHSQPDPAQWRTELNRPLLE